MKFSSRFFSSAEHNTRALAGLSIAEYTFSNMRGCLRTLGLNKAAELHTKDLCHAEEMFQRVLPQPAWQHLNLTPVEILRQAKIEAYSSQIKEIKLSDQIRQLSSTMRQRLEDDLVRYPAMIKTTFYDNPLADRHYEADVEARENITEAEHAEQSFILAMELGLPIETCLSALLHDVSRMTHIDQVYGHCHHSEESDIINKPLGLPLEFSGIHTFAKYLLTLTSKTYCNELLSPVSRASLHVQAKNPQLQFKHHIRLINAMPGEQAIEFIYTIMFMRLVLDDLAKVPVYQLAYADSCDLLSPELVEGLVGQRLLMHVNELLQGETRVARIEELTQQLEESYKLLSRAEKHVLFKEAEQGGRCRL